MTHHNMQEGINEEKTNPNDQKEDSTNRNLDLNRRSVLKLAGATAGAAAGGLGAVSHGSQEASAVSIGEAHTIDDFEDGDLSEYEFDQGETGASVVTSPTYEGSYALEISGADTQMISMTGLDHYPAAGCVFSYWVRATGGADDTNFAYGVQNHQNKYYVNLDFTNNNFIIFKYENDNSNSLNSTNVTLNEDTWYQVEVQWQTDGTHTATLYDSSGSQLVQASATDTTWKAGGIGYSGYAADGSTIYYDRVTLDSGRPTQEFNRLIDSFEDGDLDEYAFVSGASGASVVSSPIVEGSSALKLNGTSIKMHSTSGLENYPSQGDVFSTWVRATNGAGDTNFKYGVQDGDNLYYVNLDFVNDTIRFFTYKNGSSSSQGSKSVTLNEDTWYRLELDWRKTGTHIATAYDANGTQLQQISMTDSTWTDGGIGFSAFLSGSETVYYDQTTINYSVVDDFEDGDISEYSGDTGAFSVQNTTVLEGSQTLKGTSTPAAIAQTSVDTSRGYEYSVSVKAGNGSNAKPALMACVQDPSAPLQNCYYLMADVPNNKLSLYLRDNGSSTILQQTAVTLNEETEYQLTIELRPSSIIGAVFDASGDNLAAAGEKDTMYSDGCLGIFLDGSAPGYFDYMTKQPVRDSVIDNFEDGNINEYAGTTSAYSVQSSTVLEGGFTLKCETSNAAIAHNTVKTKRGHAYRCQIMAGSNSESRPGLLACVQNSSSPSDNCYWVQADTKYNKLKLIRRDSGNTTILDEVGVTIEKGVEHQLGIELHEGKVRARLFSEHGRKVAETSAIADTTYAKGHLGVHTGGSSAPAYFDYISESQLLTIGATEVSESQSGAQDALNSQVAQDVLAELNNPSTDTTSATQTNIYASGNKLYVHSINVPMEYGELNIAYQSGGAKFVRANLDRSTMPSSLISDLSDSFDWPSAEEGILFYTDGDEVPYFARSLTDDERTDITNLVNDYDNRIDEPGTVTLKNNDGGHYKAMYYDKSYHIDDNITQVTDEIEVLQTESKCEDLHSDCATGFIIGGYSCAAPAAACYLGWYTPYGVAACVLAIGLGCIVPGQLAEELDPLSCIPYLAECTSFTSP